MGKKAVLLISVMAMLLTVGGTAAAVTYSTSTKSTLKLNRASYVGTALTKLASNAAGAALTLETDSTDPTSTPLRLQTETGSQPPMTVNSETRVDNLNADKLDGKSSEEFANGSNITSGTVAEARIDGAIARDSEVANGYIQGRGKASQFALALTPGQHLFAFETDLNQSPAVRTSFFCPSTRTNTGLVRFYNVGSETINVFSDNGEANPQYRSLAPNATFDLPTHPDGEQITYQVQGAGVATIHVYTVNRANDCHFQAQGLVTRP